MGVGVGTHSQGDPITADYNQRARARTNTHAAASNNAHQSAPPGE